MIEASYDRGLDRICHTNTVLDVLRTKNIDILPDSYRALPITLNIKVEAMDSDFGTLHPNNGLDLELH